MVYFDQRGGGFSHGCRAVELTEEQFVEDLEVLVDLIQHKYPQAQNLFLMGHSWGGFLGTSFLKTGSNQQDFKGWIELSGSHNLPMGWASSRTFSIDYAQNKIAENSPDKSAWEKRLQELEDTPLVTDYETLLVVNYVAQIIDQEVNKNSVFENPSFLYLLTSPIGTGLEQKDNFRVEELLVNRNLNPEMNLITLPSLLIYGEKDAIVTSEMGQNGYDYLGTDPDDKYLVLLEESGHDIWAIEPVKFFETVQTFVETYK